MPSISLLADLLSQPHFQLRFQPPMCLRKRLRTNRCQLCIDACPSDALTLRGNEIVLRQEKCSACMTCISCCPQDAFSSNVDLLSIVSSIKNKDTAHISCMRQRVIMADQITLPCVGIISRELLVALCFKGSEKIHFNLVECNECMNRAAADTFLKYYQEINSSLKEVIETEIVVEQDIKDVEEIEFGRRKYLAEITKGVTKLASLSWEGGKTSCLEKIPNRRIPINVRFIKDLIETIDPKAQTAILRTFGNHLVADDNCTSCPLCKGICPTGALRISKVDGKKLLLFAPLDCNGCRLCVEFCKSKALHLCNNKNINVLHDIVVIKTGKKSGDAG